MISQIRITAKTNLPTEFGVFQFQSFRDASDDGVGEPHLLLTYGMAGSAVSLTAQKTAIPLIRIHSECLTGEVFHSNKCDCGAQLQFAMKRIAEQGIGALIYLRQEGRGIGIESKIQTYALQELGLDTVDANLALGRQVDERDYQLAVSILQRLKIKSCHLITQNPEKLNTLLAAGIDVLSCEDVNIELPQAAADYLQCKRQRLGHRRQLVAGNKIARN